MSKIHLRLLLPLWPHGKTTAPSFITATSSWLTKAARVEHSDVLTIPNTLRFAIADAFKLTHHANLTPCFPVPLRFSKVPDSTISFNSLVQPPLSFRQSPVIKQPQRREKSWGTPTLITVSYTDNARLKSWCLKARNSAKTGVLSVMVISGDLKQQHKWSKVFKKYEARQILTLPANSCPVGDHRSWWESEQIGTPVTAADKSNIDKYKWSIDEVTNTLTAPGKVFPMLLRNTRIRNKKIITMFLFTAFPIPEGSPVLLPEDQEKINDACIECLMTTLSTAGTPVQPQWNHLISTMCPGFDGMGPMYQRERKTIVPWELPSSTPEAHTPMEITTFFKQQGYGQVESTHLASLVTYTRVQATRKQQQIMEAFTFRIWTEELGLSPITGIHSPRNSTWPKALECQCCNQPTTTLYKLIYTDGKGPRLMAWQIVRKIANSHKTAPYTPPDTWTEKEKSYVSRMREYLYANFIKSGLLICYGDYVAHEIKFDKDLREDLALDKSYWHQDKTTNRTILHDLGCTQESLLVSVLVNAQEVPDPSPPLVPHPTTADQKKRKCRTTAIEAAAGIEPTNPNTIVVEARQDRNYAFTKPDKRHRRPVVECEHHFGFDPAGLTDLQVTTQEHGKLKVIAVGIPFNKQKDDPNDLVAYLATRSILQPTLSGDPKKQKKKMEKSLYANTKVQQAPTNTIIQLLKLKDEYKLIETYKEKGNTAAALQTCNKLRRRYGHHPKLTINGALLKSRPLSIIKSLTSAHVHICSTATRFGCSETY